MSTLSPALLLAPWLAGAPTHYCQQLPCASCTAEEREEAHGVRTARLRFSVVTSPQRHSHLPSGTQTLPNVRDSISLTNVYNTYTRHM